MGHEKNECRFCHQNTLSIGSGDGQVLYKYTVFVIYMINADLSPQDFFNIFTFCQHVVIRITFMMSLVYDFYS